MLCPGTLLDMLQAATQRHDEDPDTEEVTLDA